MISWKLQRRKIAEITEHEKNARFLSKHDHKHLKTSVDKFGMIDKPIINTNGVLIGGHQRLAILKENGIKTVECWVPDRMLLDSEVDELNIRLNKNTGSWDYDILANEWNMSDLLDWGFLEEEFEVQAVEDLGATEEEEEPSPDDKTPPFTQLGDLYQLGDQRLICGDSTDPDTVSKLLDEAKPILMVTDPPYGVNYDASWRKKGNVAVGKVANDDKTDWSLAYALFAGNVAYVWHAGWFSNIVKANLENAKFEIKSQIIWAKQHFAISRGHYHFQHEPCWYAIRKGESGNWQGSRKESTLWEISNLSAFGKSQNDERTDHSTQKPLECMARPIRNSTAIGQGVYDPFAGSGTTLIAAHRLKRKSYNIELVPKYCDIIVKRFIKEKKDDDIVLKNGEPFEL